MQHQKSKIDIDPIIHSDTCMETTFFVKNKNKEWKMSPNSKLREVTEAKTETAGKGVNSLIFPPGFDARGFRDIQAKPVDEETSSDRRFCAGSHAQQRSHPRCRAADEVTKDIFVVQFSFPGRRSSAACKGKKMRPSDVSPPLYRFARFSCLPLLRIICIEISGATERVREGQIPIT